MVIDNSLVLCIGVGSLEADKPLVTVANAVLPSPG